MSWDQGLRRDLLPWFRWIVSYVKYYDPVAAVSSGFRTFGEQTRLYRRFLAGLMPGPVAPPGQSRHEKGEAIDVLAREDALIAAGRAWEAAGGRWGGAFKGKGKYDPIHFEGPA